MAVNPRSGAKVSYVLNSKTVRPMLVVVVAENYIEGYTYCTPEEGGIQWVRATYGGGKMFPPEHLGIAGTWFYPFPIP